MKDVLAPPGTRLRLAAGAEDTEVDLYSEEGRDLVAALWMKLATEFRLMYEPTWLGIPIIQLPADIVAMQELIWRLRPDFVIETGVAHGGSAILYASVLELIGHGQVIGVDIEIRAHNRAAIERHPLAARIQLVEGSSTDRATFEQVRRRCGVGSNMLVVLDSNHTTEHVRREMEMYSGLVPPGGYLVTMDAAQAYVSDIPRGKAEWRNDNPLHAIRDFLDSHPEFEVDPHFTRFLVTSSPEGFLRRQEEEEK